MSLLIKSKQIYSHTRQSEFKILFFLGCDNFQNEFLQHMIRTFNNKYRDVKCIKVEYSEFKVVFSKHQHKFHKNHVIILGCNKILNFVRYAKWKRVEKLFSECISANNNSKEDRKRIKSHPPDDRYDFLIQPVLKSDSMKTKHKKSDRCRRGSDFKTEAFIEALELYQGPRKSPNSSESSYPTTDSGEYSIIFSSESDRSSRLSDRSYGSSCWCESWCGSSCSCERSYTSTDSSDTSFSIFNNSAYSFTSSSLSEDEKRHIQKQICSFPETKSTTYSMQKYSFLGNIPEKLQIIPASDKPSKYKKISGNPGSQSDVAFKQNTSLKSPYMSNLFESMTKPSYYSEKTTIRPGSLKKDPKKPISKVIN